MIYFIVWLFGYFFFCGIFNDAPLSFFWPITMPCVLFFRLGEIIKEKFNA